MTPHPNLSPRRALRRGFTLVEACVVLAVLGILAAIAAPSMQDLINSRRLEGTAAQLATDIYFARTDAVARNVTVSLSLHTLTDGSCYVVHTGSADLCDCQSAAATGPAICKSGAVELKTVRLSAANRVSMQATRASLPFNPFVSKSSSAGTLCLTGTNNRRVNQVVNWMGRVRWCTPPPNAVGCSAC